MDGHGGRTGRSAPPFTAPLPQRYVLRGESGGKGVTGSIVR